MILCEFVIGVDIFIGSFVFTSESLSLFKGIVSKVHFHVKVARYSFSGSIPPTFERKLSRHKQRFGKSDTTVVLDEDEILL